MSACLCFALTADFDISLREQVVREAATTAIAAPAPAPGTPAAIAAAKPAATKKCTSSFSRFTLLFSFVVLALVYNGLHFGSIKINCFVAGFVSAAEVTSLLRTRGRSTMKDLLKHFKKRLTCTCICRRRVLFAEGWADLFAAVSVCVCLAKEEQEHFSNTLRNLVEMETVGSNTFLRLKQGL